MESNMDVCGPHNSYEEIVFKYLSPWVHWFHSFSHHDLRFSSVDPIFNPYSEDYMESLWIIAAKPFLIGILTTICLVIYTALIFNGKCKVQKESEKSCLHRTCLNAKILKCACIVVAISIIGILLSCITINNKISQASTKSTDELIDMSDDLSNHLNEIYTETETLENFVHMQYLPTIDKLHGILRNNTKEINEEISHIFKSMDYMKGNISDLALILNVNNLRNNTSIGNFPQFGKDLKNFQNNRYYPVILLLIILSVFSIISPIIVIKFPHRYHLLIIIILIIISLIVCWTLVSYYAAFNVALSDFCLCYKPYLKRKLSYNIPTDASYYYMTCDKNSMPYSFVPFVNSSTFNNNFRKMLYDIDIDLQQNYNKTLYWPTMEEIIGHMVHLTHDIIDVIVEIDSCWIFYRSKFLTEIGGTCSDTMSHLSNFWLLLCIVCLLYIGLVLILLHTIMKQDTLKEFDPNQEEIILSNKVTDENSHLDNEDIDNTNKYEEGQNNLLDNSNESISLMNKSPEQQDQSIPHSKEISTTLSKNVKENNSVLEDK